MDVRVHFSLHLINQHALKVYGNVEAWVHALLTLVLGGSEWSDLAPVHLRKSHQCPLDRRLGGPPELVWTLWRREKCSRLLRFKSHFCSYPSHYTASLQSVMMKKLKGKGSNSICLLFVQYWWVLISMTTVLTCTAILNHSAVLIS